MADRARPRHRLGQAASERLRQSLIERGVPLAPATQGTLKLSAFAKARAAQPVDWSKVQPLVRMVVMPARPRVRPPGCHDDPKLLARIPPDTWDHLKLVTREWKVDIKDILADGVEAICRYWGIPWQDSVSPNWKLDVEAEEPRAVLVRSGSTYRSADLRRAPIPDRLLVLPEPQKVDRTHPKVIVRISRPTYDILRDFSLLYGFTLQDVTLAALELACYSYGIPHSSAPRDESVPARELPASDEDADMVEAA